MSVSSLSSPTIAGGSPFRKAHHTGAAGQVRRHLRVCRCQPRGSLEGFPAPLLCLLQEPAREPCGDRRKQAPRRGAGRPQGGAGKDATKETPGRPTTHLLRPGRSPQRRLELIGRPARKGTRKASQGCDIRGLRPVRLCSPLRPGGTFPFCGKRNISKRLQQCDRARAAAPAVFNGSVRHYVPGTAPLTSADPHSGGRSAFPETPPARRSVRRQAQVRSSVRPSTACPALLARPRVRPFPG